MRIAEDINQEYLKTISLCTGVDIEELRENMYSYLKDGEINFRQVESIKKEFPLEEENIAKFNVSHFLTHRVREYNKLVDRETDYNLENRCIEVSSRVKKFDNIMPNTSLEERIILMYLKGCGYKEIYTRDDYKNIYRFAFTQKAKKLKVKPYKDGYITEGEFDNVVFDELIRAEFKAEEWACKYLLRLLEHSNYYIENGEYKITFVKEDVVRMVNYYLYKKMKELNKLRMDNKLFINKKIYSDLFDF